MQFLDILSNISSTTDMFGTNTKLWSPSYGDQTFKKDFKISTTKILNNTKQFSQILYERPLLDIIPNSICNTKLFGTSTKLWSP